MAWVNIWREMTTKITIYLSENNFQENVSVMVVTQKISRQTESVHFSVTSKVKCC